MNATRRRRRAITGATAVLPQGGRPRIVLAAGLCLGLILAGLLLVAVGGPAEELYRRLARMIPGWPWR
jgi:hypothetical protein